MEIRKWKVFCFDEVTSTNDVAKEKAKSNESKFIVIADNQTKGRGQYGRNWESPYGKNLLSTFSLKFSDELPLELISFLFGISVCETLSELGLTVNCKWPNDVLVKNAKIAGILIEKDDSRYYIGIGLNVLWPDSIKCFENNISRTSIIGELNLSFDCEIIARKIADSFDFWAAKSYGEIFEKYKSFWNDKDKNVKVNIDGNWIAGKLVSVLRSGGVSVELNSGENVEIYSSAQISYEY